MSLSVAGMGWVTPLGAGIDEVWKRLLGGEEASAESLTSPVSDRRYTAFRVPPSALASGPIHPRLRRSSAISRFAAVAGLAALDVAEVSRDPEMMDRIALIFAVSNGGVVYTKRFYQEVVATGAQSASPLLFPETVFNAPASHLAAILGVTGVSYTLVGDGAVGILALKMADDLLQSESLDYCLVVGAEEVDWLLCDAYRTWRLTRAEPLIEPFQPHPRGMVLSEGAGALLVGRDGDVEIESVDAGGNFRQQTEAPALLGSILSRICDDRTDLVVASANGTFIDHAEADAIRDRCPRATVYAPKAALGESVGASGLWQTICAAQALRTGVVPPTLHRPASPDVRLSTGENGRLRDAVVASCGLNQQAAALRLRAAS